MRRSNWDTLVSNRESWEDGVPVKPPFKWKVARAGLGGVYNGIAVYGIGDGNPYHEWCCLVVECSKDVATMTDEEQERVGQSLIDLWTMKYNAHLAQKGEER